MCLTSFTDPKNRGIIYFNSTGHKGIGNCPVFDCNKKQLGTHNCQQGTDSNPNTQLALFCKYKLT